MNAKTIIFFLILCILIFVSFSCKEEPPVKPPPVEPDSIKNTINLSIEWTDLYRINLKWNKAEEDTLNSFRYDLIRRDEAGTEVTIVFYLFGADTSYTDDNDGDSLNTGTNYRYRIKAYNASSELKDTSLTVITQTLSPTSHNISWQVDTLGQPGNFLYDVWGLDENNVWAVGYVDLPEGGSGIIKWDGIDWKPFPSSGGVKYGIFGFSKTSLFVIGQSINRGFAAIWNGSSWTEYYDDYFLSKGDTVYPLYSVWGSSPDDVWAVGDQGTIIHWDGVEWKKVNSFVNISINDIWGESSTGIYATGYKNPDFNTSALLKFNGAVWEIVTTIQMTGYEAQTLWKVPGGRVLTGGRGLLEFEGSTYSEINIPGRTRYIEKVRGSAVNNIFTTGHFGEITHYNGLTWANIDDFEVPTGTTRIFYSIWTNGNIVFICGREQTQAIILRGVIN